MTDDLYDTSSIADERAYWNALAGRVTAAVAADRGRGITPLGASRWCLPAAAACLLAAVFVGLASIYRAPADLARPAWQSAFASKDDVGRRMILAVEPPSIVELMQSTGLPLGGGR